MSDQPTLFPSTRSTDPITSFEAAEVIRPKLLKLQKEVLWALFHMGPMTDEKLQSLPQFKGYAPSTVRTRRAELRHLGYIENSGYSTNIRGRRVIVWRLTYDTYEGMKE